MSRLNQLFQFLDNQPNEPFILFAIAKEYEKAKDEQNALDYYLRLRDTTPQYVGLYYHLGKLYERLAQIDAAVEAYRTGMTVAKAENDRHAYSELAAAKLNLVDDDDDDDG
jgi:tetratricopeptide (TPR) repeat protein